MTINPYLTFPDTTDEALTFYAEVFGGSIEAMQRVKDSPLAGDMPPEAQNKVLHARLRIGDGYLMASDALQGNYSRPEGVSLQHTFDDLDRAKRVFLRLAKNGEVVMPFEPTFWAAGFGLCRDRYGVSWMINCETDPEDA